MRIAPPHLQRQAWNQNECLIPELYAFGWNKQFIAKNQGLSPHKHDYFEICYILRGSVQWHAEGECHTVPKNHVYISKPGEIHGGIDHVLEPSEIYWLQPAFPASAPLPGLTLSETKALKDGLQKLTLRAFPASHHTLIAFQDIHRELAHPNPAARVVLRAALHRLLVEILRDHDAATSTSPKSPNQAPQPTPAILAVKKAIDHNPGEDLSVNEMARLAGLGVSRFHERFARELGISPADYRHRARINKAKEFLTQSDLSITRIALQLGFSSSQHFAASFRKFVGQTPSHYRRNTPTGF
jgi:AraC-like DNA-binding protein